MKKKLFMQITMVQGTMNPVPKGEIQRQKNVGDPSLMIWHLKQWPKAGVSGHTPRCRQYEPNVEPQSWG